MVVEKLEAALKSAQIRPEDAATVELALTYARSLDDGADPARVGPPFLACLTALGMTPAARAALAGKGAGDDKPTASPLDELRAKRKARETAS